MFRTLLLGSLLLTSSLLAISPSYAVAPAPSVYESMSGTANTNMDNSAGSSGSLGFTGNWIKVLAQKQGPAAGLAAIYTNTYNSQLAFPANSRFTVPANNTYASTSSSIWSMYYSARQLSTPLNFDTNGTFYLSYLMEAPFDGASTGSAVMGILNGLPTASTDTSKNAIFVGWTYNSGLTIQPTSANYSVWYPTNTYPYTGPASSASANNKSWFVIVKITTVASGNDTIQAKEFAPTDTLPVSDSSLTWDVSYSAAITGSWGYLSAQTEYNGLIDELRGGSTYESVAGAPTTPVIGAPTVVGTPNKGINTNLTVTVGAAGYFRFYIDGKRIPACLKVVATGSSPNFTATCNWKPPVRGLHSVYATYISTDVSYLNTSTPSALISVISRTNNR